MKEIGCNFFKVVSVKLLDEENGFYRVTLTNEYVSTNDIIIVMAFNIKPEIDQRILLIAYET